MKAMTGGFKGMGTSAPQSENTTGDGKEGLDDIKKQLAEAQDFDIEREIEQTIDPSGELSNTIHDMAEPVDEAKSLAEDTAKSVEQDEAEADTKALPDASRATGRRSVVGYR